MLSACEAHVVNSFTSTATIVFQHVFWWLAQQTTHHVSDEQNAEILMEGWKRKKRGGTNSHWCNLHWCSHLCSSEWPAWHHLQRERRRREGSENYRRRKTKKLLTNVHGEEKEQCWYIFKHNRNREPCAVTYMERCLCSDFWKRSEVIWHTAWSSPASSCTVAVRKGTQIYIY